MMRNMLAKDRSSEEDRAPVLERGDHHRVALRGVLAEDDQPSPGAEHESVPRPAALFDSRAEERESDQRLQRPPDAIVCIRREAVRPNQAFEVSTCVRCDYAMIPTGATTVT